MIVITGAGGRLGRELMTFWQEKGLAMRAVDLIEKPWFTGHEEIIGDVRDPAVMKKAVAGAAAVVHVAEARPEGRVLEQFGPSGYDKHMFDFNLEGTRRLAAFARDAGVARFLFLSSECVYGPPPRQCPCTEQAPTEPNGPYGRSKLEAEMALLEMHRRGEIEPVIVRPAMILGPFHGRWELLNRMFALARRHLPLPIVGDGHKLKHCVHSRDVVELADRCLARPQAAGRVYNVAGRSAATLNEIAHAVIRAYRSRSFVVPVPRVLFQTANLLTTWLGDPLVAPEFAQHPWRHTCYETGRAQAELGWRAKYDTVQTVLAAALWYRGPGPDVRQSLLSDEE